MARPPHIAEFMQLSESVKAVRQATGRRDFSQVHFAILVHFVIEPGATPSAVAREYGLESDGVAKILRSLSSAGYVASIEDEQDRRIKHYYITDSGWEVASAYLTARELPIPPKDSVPIAKVRRPTVKGGGA